MSMCKKMLTFSYDDGIYQDERLVEIFNKYGMKAVSYTHLTLPTTERV